MKNPRRVTLSAQLITQHQLSTDAPPSDALFWKFWNANKSTAEKALNTDFIQNIKKGTLDPVTYGAFNVSDAYYCFHGAEDYRTATNKAKDPALKAYLNAKTESYDSYNATFPTTWRVRDGSSIVPTDVCKKYSDFESTVVNNEMPIYCLIAMLPCEYLWAWLGQELNPPLKGNLYASWITGNNDASGAYAMGNFLDLYQQKYPGVIDENKAMRIYGQAMEFEYLNFETAVTKDNKGS